MKAVVRYEYGSPDVLRIEDVPKPVPRPHELLIRVRTVSLNLGEWELLTGRPRFIRVLASIFGPRPRVEPDTSSLGLLARLRAPKYKILATDFAGQVESVGDEVAEFRPGDDVFGMCFFGALAEYVCVSRRTVLARRPDDMTFEEAAALPQASYIALQAMRDVARVHEGMRVLINGAGGGAGSLAVQIAKHCGAHVTAVDNSHKQEMMRSIGADHVIDYTKEDFTRNGERYDVILDLAAHRSIFDCTERLTDEGLYMLVGGGFGPTAQAAFLKPLARGNRRVVFLLAEERKENLMTMIEMKRAGTVVPIIDRTLPFEEAPQAFQLVGDGKVCGKIVLTV